MGMRAENLRAFRTDRPAAKCGSFGGTRNDADVPGHTLILRKIVSVTVRELADLQGSKAAPQSRCARFPGIGFVGIAVSGCLRISKG